MCLLYSDTTNQRATQLLYYFSIGYYYLLLLDAFKLLEFQD